MILTKEQLSAVMKKYQEQLVEMHSKMPSVEIITEESLDKLMKAYEVKGKMLAYMEIIQADAELEERNCKILIN